MKRTKPLGILSNTLHECNKNQNLWEGEGGGGGGVLEIIYAASCLANT